MQENPQNGELSNSALLEWEACLTPRYMPLPVMCYHVKFGSSVVKGVRINRNEPPKIGGALGPAPLGVEAG